MAGKEETKTGAARPRLGFNDKGEAYPGVDPETGERVTVTLDALRREFGPKKGEEMFVRVRHAHGTGNPFDRVEVDPRDLQLTDLAPERRERINAILEGRE